MRLNNKNQRDGIGHRFNATGVWFNDNNNNSTIQLNDSRNNQFNQLPLMYLR